MKKKYIIPIYLINETKYQGIKWYKVISTNDTFTSSFKTFSRRKTGHGKNKSKLSKIAYSPVPSYACFICGFILDVLEMKMKTMFLKNQIHRTILTVVLF